MALKNPRVQLYAFLLTTSLFLVWLDFHLEQNAVFKPVFYGHNKSFGIFSEHELLPGGKNIFFIETNDQVKTLSPRLLCAFESAALHNAEHRVFVLFVHNEHNADPVYPIFMPNNVFFRKIGLNSLLKNSEAFVLWSSGQLQHSKFALNNLSNVARLVLLFKYGGTYFDSDVINLRPLDDYQRNFVVAEGQHRLNNAILSFRDKKHSFLKLALHMLVSDYRGDEWGHQGPGLMSRVANVSCSFFNMSWSMQNPLKCHEIFILTPNQGYAIPYTHWKLLFQPKRLEFVQNKLKQSLAVHYWNAMLHWQGAPSLALRTSMPIYRVFRQNCPVTEQKALREYVGFAFE